MRFLGKSRQEESRLPSILHRSSNTSRTHLPPRSHHRQVRSKLTRYANPLILPVGLFILLLIFLTSFLTIARVGCILVIFTRLGQIFLVATRYGAVVPWWRAFKWRRAGFLVIGCLLDVGGLLMVFFIGGIIGCYVSEWLMVRERNIPMA